MSGDKLSALAFCAAVACIEVSVILVIALQIRAALA